MCPTTASFDMIFLTINHILILIIDAHIELAVIDDDVSGIGCTATGECLLELLLEEYGDVLCQVLFLDSLHEKLHALDKLLIVLGVISIDRLQLLVQSDHFS